MTSLKTPSRLHLFAFAAALVSLGLGVGLIVGSPTFSSAQSSGGNGVAIAGGPGGMWIVQGNSVTVCVQGVQSGVAPASPVCGPPTRYLSASR